MPCHALYAQCFDQVLAQPPRSPRRHRAQFPFVSRYHHRKALIVSEMHDKTFTDTDPKGKQQTRQRVRPTT
jgi:hypothetical protein